MNDETRTLLLYLRQCLTFNRRALRIIDRSPDPVSALKDWVENELWIWLLSQDRGWIIIVDVGDLNQVDWQALVAALRGDGDGDRQ